MGTCVEGPVREKRMVRSDLTGGEGGPDDFCDL